VIDAQDLHHFGFYAINDYVRKRGKYKFSAAMDPSRASQVRKDLQATDALIEVFATSVAAVGLSRRMRRTMRSRSSTASGDQRSFMPHSTQIVEKFEEIIASAGRPADFHQD
jgi:hypothetical protein